MTGLLDLEHLIIKLREATNELSRLHRELGTIRGTRFRIKAEAWRDMDAPSVAAGERAIAIQTIDLDVDEARLRADIDSWQAEVLYLTTAIQVASGHAAQH